MSLDGLRAWIGEVERKLGMRTRVFLVLTAIAIAGAAAGIYLALEAANESVSKDEVQALQERVEAGAGEAGTGTEAATVAALKAELETLRTQVSELESEKGGNGASSGGTSSGAEKTAPKGGASASPKGGAAQSNKEKLKELFEQAK
jgi:hypothetical protein